MAYTLRGKFWYPKQMESPSMDCHTAGFPTHYFYHSTLGKNLSQ